MAASIDILQAINDPNIFGRQVPTLATFEAWRSFLAALFALPADPNQLTVFRDCTGRHKYPKNPANEAWLICGRRSGKSFALALVAVFLACIEDWRQYLRSGEKGVVLIIAADREQAGVIFGYISDLLDNASMLGELVTRRTATTIDLKKGIRIRVATTNYKTVRGYTIVAALCDELAFWPSDTSVSPDHAILSAIRPGMATVPGAKLLCASSPYSRHGALYEAYHRHFGKDNDRVLVWQAETRVMNPTVPQSFIDQAYADDPESASAEYGAQFRRDVEAFITREAIEACVEPGRSELRRRSQFNYQAFVDPSGGSQDSMTLAIGHREDDRVVIDCIRERKPPFSPDGVVREFAQVIQAYGLSTVAGDRYAGEWPRERFAEYGVRYEISAKSKSDLYRDLLPLINSQRIEFLDCDGLVAQLAGLERQTARSGKDLISHGPRGHDDIANAVAGVASLHHEPLRMWC